MPRPYVLDNLTDKTTHAAALAYLVDDFPTGYGLSVATGYVNLGGLHHLATIVDDGRQVRLLIGVAPDPALGADFPLRRFGLRRRALAADRDLARFPPSPAARQLADVDRWLDDPT